VLDNWKPLEAAGIRLPGTVTAKLLGVKAVSGYCVIVILEDAGRKAGGVPAARASGDEARSMAARASNERQYNEL
jgi:hypothetical protein